MTKSTNKFNFGKFSLIAGIAILMTLVSLSLISSLSVNIPTALNITFIINYTTPILGNVGEILFFNTSNTARGDSNLTFNSTTNQLSINRNTAPISPPSITGTAFRINCADNENCRLGMTSFGAGGVAAFSARSARGTGASPLPTKTNDLLGQFDAFGRSTSAFTTSPRAMMKIVADENFTDTAQGSRLEFWITPNKTIVPVKVMIIQDSMVNVTTNLIVNGNFSAKRPYWNGYDNSTQNFLNTLNTQIVNISNNQDIDSYLINVVGSQNLTFEQTGDYVCILSPEFYQASGTNKIVTFWIQKNGVDVPWSNSRYTITNGQYFAPSITYQFDITNPATDNIRFMWYSDSTSTQIISISGLTSPTRPSIPGILLNCQKISEITP